MDSSDPKGRGLPKGNSLNWTSGFLPGAYQGTWLKPSGDPIDNMKRLAEVSDGDQQAALAMAARLNRLHHELILAALLVNIDAPPDDHLHAVTTMTLLFGPRDDGCLVCGEISARQVRSDGKTPKDVDSWFCHADCPVCDPVEGRPDPRHPIWPEAAA